MSYSVFPSELFKKQAKRLGRKYSSLKGDLEQLNASLEKEPAQGIALGGNLFKIRVAVKSKGKGKSGGARVVTYLVSKDREIFLLTIYDKSEFDSVDDRMLKQIVKTLARPEEEGER